MWYLGNDVGRVLPTRGDVVKRMRRRKQIIILYGGIQFQMVCMRCRFVGRNREFVVVHICYLFKKYYIIIKYVHYIYMLITCCYANVFLTLSIKYSSYILF